MSRGRMKCTFSFLSIRLSLCLSLFPSGIANFEFYLNIQHFREERKIDIGDFVFFYRSQVTLQEFVSRRCIYIRDTYRFSRNQLTVRSGNELSGIREGAASLIGAREMEYI